MALDEQLETEPKYKGIKYNLLGEKYNKREGGEKEGCGCCSCGCLIMAGLTGLILYEIYNFLF